MFKFVKNIKVYINRKNDLIDNFYDIYFIYLFYNIHLDHVWFRRYYGHGKSFFQRNVAVIL